MLLIPEEALPHFENMIYLPMLLIILKKDRNSFEEGPFKLKGPYVKLVDEATRGVRAELRKTTIYLRRHNMKVIRNRTDDTFTEYIFVHRDNKDHRRYLNIRLRNRTEELLNVYFTMAES